MQSLILDKLVTLMVADTEGHTNLSSGRFDQKMETIEVEHLGLIFKFILDFGYTFL